MLLIDQPAGNPRETGPPESPDAGARQDGSELLTANTQQLLLGVVRHPLREAAVKGVERLVNHRAEFSAAGIGVEFLQRPQSEDMAGIDRIGIAQPGLDLR